MSVPRSVADVVGKHVVFETESIDRMFLNVDNLDLGRPDKVPLIFDRRVLRNTRSRFRTRVITEHVIPGLRRRGSKRHCSPHAVCLT